MSNHYRNALQNRIKTLGEHLDTIEKEMAEVNERFADGDEYRDDLERFNNLEKEAESIKDRLAMLSDELEQIDLERADLHDRDRERQAYEREDYEVEQAELHWGM